MSVELPEDAFSALRTAPEGFVAEMRLAAAVKWYEPGLLSQSKAAEAAGVTRHALLDALGRFKVTPFHASPEQLAQELNRASTVGRSRLAPDRPGQDRPAPDLLAALCISG